MSTVNKCSDEQRILVGQLVSAIIDCLLQVPCLRDVHGDTFCLPDVNVVSFSSCETFDLLLSLKVAARRYLPIEGLCEGGWRHALRRNP